jgi:inorganic pyrophosphatase
MYIGKVVTVTIDRPLGSRHPRYGDIVYPLNYGYIASTLSGDGMPIDAYVLGVDEPVSEIQAVVIAVILRTNDREDKLIVAPEGMSFTVEQIKALVEFQERFFESDVVVK